MTTPWVSDPCLSVGKIGKYVHCSPFAENYKNIFEAYGSLHCLCKEIYPLPIYPSDGDQSPIALMYIKDLAYLDPTIRISLLLIPTRLFWMFLKVSQSPYISLITVTTRLFNSSPWKITIFKFGKPSIPMGHLYHGYVSHSQRVVIIHQIPIIAAPQPVFHGELSMLLAEGYHLVMTNSLPWKIG